MQEELGRLDGSGATSPARARYRLIVAGDTRKWWWRSRCQAMVCGPASRPCPASSFRSLMISSAVLSGIARGEVFGRRERGSNAASPPARYRATSRDTHPWDTPQARATSPWLRPSTTTAVMTRRAFDTARPCRPGHSYVLRHVSCDTPFVCPAAGHHTLRTVACSTAGHTARKPRSGPRQAGGLVNPGADVQLLRPGASGAPGVRLRPGGQVRNRRRLRPRTGPGTKHDQHDPDPDEHDAADEQANTDRKRVRDGQLQPSGEGHR